MKDVPKLFDNNFNILYNAWIYYNQGIGYPSEEHFTKLDPDYVKIIIEMENHFKRHFSSESTTIKYLEAILRRG